MREFKSSRFGHEGKHNLAGTTLKIALLFCIMLTSLPLFAREPELPSGWYLRIDGGISTARDPHLTIPSGALPADLGKSSVFGGGLGYAIVSGLRTDVTILYRSDFQQISGFPQMPQGKADFRSLTTLVSAYMDVFSISHFSPYIGIGIGLANNHLGNVAITNTDGSPLAKIEGKTKTNFAWQLCAGGNVVLHKNWLIDAGYHYLSTGDYVSKDPLVFIDGTTKTAKNRGSFRGHEVIVSLQFTF